MKYRLLKAQAKKKKFIKRVAKIRQEEDSDGDLSSDDEIEVSNNFIGKLLNDKYLVIKYLSRGTFCKVWLVYDLTIHRYFALKIQEDEDEETLINEINMLNLIHRENIDKNICHMVNYFDIKIDGKMKKAILLELLGDSLGNLVFEDNDDIINMDMIKKIMKSILEGINSIHNKNLIHCDLKLDNILFCEPNKKIKSVMEDINKLDLHNSYNKVLSETLNSKLIGLTKSKRKTVKKKIKKKVIRELIRDNMNNIIEISNKLCSINPNSIGEINIEEFDDSKGVYKENKYKLDINLDRINVKLLDLGNTEEVSNKNDEEIYTRCYRPPENIINGTFDTKSDIWVIGCMLYELFTGDTIFDFDDCDKVDIEKDRFHLAQMYSLLGKMPRDLTLECEYSDDYFDMKGRILRNKNIEMRDLKDELTNRIEMEDEELDLTMDFLLRMLEYNPKERLTAEELLKHKWLETEENLIMEIV
jgi:serine/threonine protein kinase